ncbi:hypothetical protein [Streptomyces sp. NBC_01089]|uniref:hypothetical protein n=1 Tax=Streptomyces sp. NBC_01089 TaxID=2903747 RepID=UPI00386C1C25|nr:hypothetical protein OG510_18975 [Streptomyces sp. NBC_01089]
MERHVSGTLRPYCDQRGYPYKGRKKQLVSLSEKLESGRYSRWSEVDDLYACTVVVPTAAHEDSVLGFLSDAFEEVEVRRRNSTQKAPDVFRFDSTRYIGRIESNPGLDLPEGVQNIQFEVQIPTAFEYAWAVVTHDLVYKSENFDWREQRLASLLKASVEQSELLIAGFQSNVSIVPKSAHPDSDAKNQIVDIFRGLVISGSISKELTPTSWSRFADNFYSLAKSYSSRRAAPVKAVELANAIAARIEGSDEWSELMSGSLFQVVLGMVGGKIAPAANLNNFVVVDSVELRDFHNLEHIPKVFDFNS